jgi:Type I phosphodiesterase / nucleotide pyrophosphatase
VAPSSKQKLAKYGLLLCAQVLALLVFVLLSRAESGRPHGTRDVPLPAPVAHRKLAIVFVDSLSDRVAVDPQVMPNLGALAQRGVSLEVTPCRDQLTYLCLRALLTGYDESSLLAVRGNFNHEKSASDNLLDRAAEAGLRIAVVGSHDFEPYGGALFKAKFGAGDAKSEALLFSDLARLDPERRADVTLFSLSNGDRTAHAFGTHSPKYSEAFRALDGIIGRVVTWAGPDADVLVFGDHGHDEMGRHLPGLASTSYAVYAGPSFRRGVSFNAALTDHRAILGLLLGVPTPPSYSGPGLDRIFAAGQLSAAQLQRLPELQAPAVRSSSRIPRYALAGLTLLLAVVIGRKLLELAGLARGPAETAAALGALLMAAAGSNYDAVRHRIHDHGSEPIRSFYLLVPLALGFALAAIWRRRNALLEHPFERTLERGAFATVLVSFCLLFPTAYYYGASRGTVLAAGVSVLTVFAMRVHLLPSRRERMAAAVLALCIVGSLWSLYGLRDVGGQTREMAYFVLSSPLFDRFASLTLLAATFGLWLCFASARDRSGRDLALAAFLGVTSLLLERLALPVARYLLPVAMAGYVWLRFKPVTRFVATRFFSGVIALGLFYGEEALHVAPMLVLALCLLLTLHFWRRFLPNEPEARATAVGLTLAVACYFLLWPTIGMRFSGIDFRFMFEWVPLARYEELWWVIGLGMVLKFVWPYALLADLARRSVGGRTQAWVCLTFGLKLLALAVFAAWYATSHALLSNGALEILAELALLIVLGVFAWPSPVRAMRAIFAEILLPPLGRAERACDSGSPLHGPLARPMMSSCVPPRSRIDDPERLIPSPVQTGRSERSGRGGRA